MMCVHDQAEIIMKRGGWGLEDDKKVSEEARGYA